MINNNINSRKAYREVFIAGFFGNLMLAALKLAAGLLGLNKLILMDGLVSFVNAVIFLFMWQGDILDKKESDEKHPYGYGKAIFLILFIAGLILMVLSIYMLFYSITTTSAWGGSVLPFIIAILVTLLSIFGNELLYRYLRTNGNVYMNNIFIWSASNNRLNVLVSTVVFFALVFSSTFGAALLKKIGVGLIAAIMFVMSIKMFIMTFNGIMDKCPPKSIIQKIEQYAKNANDVKNVMKIKARYIGAFLYVDVFIAMQEETILKDADKTARALEKILIEKIPFMREANVLIE